MPCSYPSPLPLKNCRKYLRSSRNRYLPLRRSCIAWQRSYETKCLRSHQPMFRMLRLLPRDRVPCCDCFKIQGLKGAIKVVSNSKTRTFDRRCIGRFCTGPKYVASPKAYSRQLHRLPRWRGANNMIAGTQSPTQPANASKPHQGRRFIS